MSTALKNACPVCDKREGLKRCQGCLVVSYCTREHQITHRESHKRACNAVKKSKQQTDHEEAELRADPETEDVFEEEVGRFWGIFETRKYMRARYGYVEALRKIDTYAAAQAAADNIRDMLSLCRGDNMGIRDLMPALYLRLGQDQECYDFVKWWCQDHDDYDWSDLSLPYLDIHDADVFKDVDLFVDSFGDGCQVSSIVLIKIRLYLDLESLQGASVIGGMLPTELLDNIRGQFLSNVIAHNPRSQSIMKGEGLGELMALLKPQIKKLYEKVKKDNKYFWPAVLNPGHHLTALSAGYSRGSVQEMELWLQYSYAAWKETPRALGVLKKLVDGTF